MSKSSAFVLVGFLLAACTVSSPAPVGHVVGPDEAQAILWNATATARVEATQAARVTAEAQATRAAYAFDVTATADALQAAESAREATQRAQAAEFSAQATVDAYNGAQAAQALQATAQTARLTRSERTQDLMATLGPLFALALLIGLIAAAILGLVALANYLASIDRRRSLVETRTGTILLLASPQGLMAQVLARPMLDNVPLEDEWVSQAERAEPIPVYQHGRFQTVLERVAQPDDPDRRLMLRLLRAAMLAVGPDSPRLPGYRELDWPAETWTKAVALLKPHVITKPGRSGGTFCNPSAGSGGETLLDLYNAVGERRITALPSPRLALSEA